MAFDPGLVHGLGKFHRKTGLAVERHCIRAAVLDRIGLDIFREARVCYALPVPESLPEFLGDVRGER